MGIGSLLAVGQSLQRAKSEPSPFKVNDEARLPRFEPVGRPVSLAPAEEAPVEPLFAAQLGAVPVAPPASDRTAAARVAAVGSRTTLRQALFGRRSAPEPMAAPRQAELRLEQVRVVRNDLTDSDLELVAASRAIEAVKAERAQAEAARTKSGSWPGMAWSWLTARLFNLGRRWR